jgi:hypothetical protein
MPGNPGLSYATAGELPPEVIRKILDQFVAGYPLIPFLGKVIKYGLSSCSLTCRCWAEVIRPILFYSITLRQPDEIMQLLDFLNSHVSVGPALSGCIVWLTLQVKESVIQAVGVMPYLHHYYGLIKRLFALRSAEMSITNDGQPVASSGHLKARALLNMLSSSLPRTLPGTCVFPVNTLTLSGLQLRSVADLVHTVDSLRTVRSCRVAGLSFAENAMRPRPLVHRRTSRLEHVYVSGCGDGSVKSQLELCSMIAHAREHLGYDVDTWSSVHTIVLAVPDDHGAVWLQLRGDPTREHRYN